MTIWALGRKGTAARALRPVPPVLTAVRGEGMLS